MSVLDTKHKRKSAVITAILMLLLIFVIFNYGMRYLDPPEEYGLAINFGDSNVGNGEPVEKTKTQPAPPTKVEEKVEEEVVEKEVKEEITEEVITDETTKEVPVVEKPKEKKKEVKKEEPKKEKVKKKPKPKPSKATKNALESLLNGNTSDGKPKGEGDDDESGVKGGKNGDVNSNKYYGNEGSGSGGNYNLKGRKALTKPIEKPDCQEEGIVVVSIEVDKDGNVIRAIAGVKGSTNTAPCLLKPAKAAAMKTKWNPDDKAPNKQRGTIIYKFSLTQ